MTSSKKVVRGGVTGRSQATRRTLYKDTKPPQMWKDFMAECRQFREAHGMSTKDLSALTGLSVGVISLLERAVSQPHPWDLTVYLEAIGVTRITIE